MKRLTAYEIALSALACAIATIFLTVGVYTEVLLFTGYLFACVALMLPLSKQSYLGYTLAYLATCLLTLVFISFRFWDLLPFIMFFGLHPLVNELQLKIKINRWVACAIKAVWFDLTMYLTWRFLFGMTTAVAFVDAWIVPLILVFGTAFFVFYDYLTYRCRAIVNTTVARLRKR